MDDPEDIVTADWLVEERHDAGPPAYIPISQHYSEQEARRAMARYQQRGGGPYRVRDMRQGGAD